MANIEKELWCKGSIRCHKGYLINAEHIEKVRSAEIDLQFEGISKSVPVGRSYEKDVRKKITEFIRVYHIRKASLQQCL